MKHRFKRRLCLCVGGSGIYNAAHCRRTAKAGNIKSYLLSRLSDGDLFAVKLYGKYIGNWGGEATVWRLDGIQNGEVVTSYTCCPGTKLHLEVTVSHTDLREGDSYDMAAVRVRILDENGNIAPYAQLPVEFSLEGDAQLVGPRVVTAEGGMTGTYVKTLGREGTAELRISTAQTEPVTVNFTLEC